MTDEALQTVREEITASNVALERQIRARDSEVAQSLRDIRTEVRVNGTEVERLQMQLHPEVLDKIDRELCERGYRECEQ